jgi:DNA polymerase-1
VPVPAERAEALRVLGIFKPVLENEAIGKVAQNAKYDIRVLANHGVAVKGALFDTMVAHFLLKPDLQKHGMDFLSEAYLGYRPVSIKRTHRRKGTRQGATVHARGGRAPGEGVRCGRCRHHLAARGEIRPLLAADQVEQLFTEVEMPLVQVLADMESEGIRIDIPALRQFSKELGDDLLRLQEQIHAACGTLFNIDSPKQLGDVLFETLKLGEGKVKKTAKTGQYQTSEDVLQELAHRIPPCP